MKHFLQSGLSRDFLVSGPLPASARPRWRQLEVRSVQSVPLFDWEAVPVLHGLTCGVSFCRVSGCRRCGSQGLIFRLVFSRHPAWPASKRTRMAEGHRNTRRWKWSWRQDSGPLAVLIAYLLQCKKRCKVENYRGGGPPSPQEERCLPNPTGFCYRGRLGNGAACWVGCFNGFNESNWKRQRRFILVSGKTSPVQHKRWFLKKS